MLNTRRPATLPDDAPALDVWLKFDPDEMDPDAPASHEANTFRLTDGGYAVGWYHNDVGLVAWETFPTHRAARLWLTAAGFDDYTA